MRHLSVTQVAHLFLTTQTERLRGEKPGDRVVPGSNGCERADRRVALTQASAKRTLGEGSHQSSADAGSKQACTKITYEKQVIATQATRNQPGGISLLHSAVNQQVGAVVLVCRGTSIASRFPFVSSGLLSILIASLRQKLGKRQEKTRKGNITDIDGLVPIGATEKGIADGMPGNCSCDGSRDDLPGPQSRERPYEAFSWARPELSAAQFGYLKVPSNQ